MQISNKNKLNKVTIKMHTIQKATIFVRLQFIFNIPERKKISFSYKIYADLLREVVNQICNEFLFECILIY